MKVGVKVRVKVRVKVCVKVCVKLCVKLCVKEMVFRGIFLQDSGRKAAFVTQTMRFTYIDTTGSPMVLRACLILRIGTKPGGHGADMI